MLAEIITIGDEILVGQIVDTNSAWLGTKLNEAGIQVYQIISVSDNAAHITEALRQALDRADVILMTGGLGPTKDDITKHTLAKFFGMELVRHRASYEAIEAMMSTRGISFNTLNQGQADLPDQCTVIPNANGTAPGMWFERNGKIVISMPGVPFEMKAIVENEVLPRLKAYFQLNAIVHKSAITQGIAESVLAETIADWENALPDYLHLAYLPNPAGIKLRLSAYEVNAGEVTQEIDRQFSLLEAIIPNYFIGYGDATVESAVLDLLATRKATLATAESCTGGTIASRITAIPGSSAAFLGSVVAYSNQVKQDVLGVKEETLLNHGAVSLETIIEMAEGVRRQTGADYAIATSGIAGPDGGTPDKPVGTVWIGIATPEGMITRKMMFGGLRDPNIQRASSAALNLLRLYLIDAEDVHIDEGIF